MQRLIDANALIERYDKVHIGKPGKARKLIEEAPTIDAVEVIRCHECIGKSTWINDPKYGCAICSMSGMYPKNENGYCSYAIRKDNKK